MNNEFVVSYINLIDGEQDPRNLMLIFNMSVIVLQHFNLGNAMIRYLDSEILKVSCNWTVELE